MNVFLSWSGNESRRAAHFLGSWLEHLFPDVNTWTSTRNLEVGSAWAARLSQELLTADFGILCLTSANLSAPWLMYEAGALALPTRPRRVVPYLLGVMPGDLPPMLQQFQSASADKFGTWSLVESIASHAGIDTRSTLRTMFDEQWPVLAGYLGLTVAVSIHDGVLLARLTEGQVFSAEQMRSLIERIKSHYQSGHSAVVIDFSAVHTMPSGDGTPAGLGLILWSLGRSRTHDTLVVFTGLTAPICAILEITKLLPLITHYPTNEVAFEHLGRRL